ncbi:MULTISPECIES: condensation domain-containing protein, partial [unclassified Sinorhizobium]|uniref:condensation domain-containing protein n=1 Tax=unclassified Sinorhizobium TaxID=2613772 RepID=UPI003525E71D
DIYPATDLQQGLLFHGMLEEGRGVYVTQLRMTLSGPLDKAALVAAWQTAIERHAILRTHFEWRHGGKALQVVRRRAMLPFAEHDWSAAEGGDAYEGRLADWLAEDLARGFDSAGAPLMRVNLFARPDGRHDHVWTCHHALLDGWASAQLLGEVMAAYTKGPAAELPPVVPYRDYIAWLKRQPSAEDWWRARLAEVADPATLTGVIEAPCGDDAAGPVFEQGLGRELSERLRRAAQRHQLTLATLMQGALAILIARYGGRPQVAYGVTVSGRPAELAGVETMVGLFINSLPVLCEVRGDEPLAQWLARLQAGNIELRQYEHTALTDVQRWAGRSGDALFDTLFVFENYPVDAELRKSEAPITIDHVASEERSHYPLTIAVMPDDALVLRWTRNASKLDHATVARLSAHYGELLTQIAAAGE